MIRLFSKATSLLRKFHIQQYNQSTWFLIPSNDLVKHFCKAISKILINSVRCCVGNREKLSYNLVNGCRARITLNSIFFPI